jgi:putative lipase involved disintegration of autophagic bodies
VARSIHVTGHSLGGALASLCSYDLSTTVAEALAAKEDPLNSEDYTKLQVNNSIMGSTTSHTVARTADNASC